MIRKNDKVHHGQVVQAITSRGRLLVAAGTDGRTVVYDYAKQEPMRDIELGEDGAGLVGTPIDLLVMEDENTLVVADSKGLHPVNILETTSSEPCK